MGYDVTAKQARYKSYEAQTTAPAGIGGESEPDSKQVMHRVGRTTRGIEAATVRLERLIGRVLL